MSDVADDAADSTPSGAPTVTVRGDAIVAAEPDEAVLWISLSALRDAPGPALADVSARSSRLVALLDELGVDKADRSTTGITVFEEIDHTQRGRKSLGHRAISRVSVRLTDSDAIGRLIAQATEELAARIDGPRWLISPSNPVRLEAARRAAADSRRKAQAYAEGVGAKLGRLIRLAEPDHHIAIRTAGGLAPMAAEPVPIEPGEHEVTASVHATFALNLDQPC
jgi:uncharacterized protein YggE